jgi:hypothetical protein
MAPALAFCLLLSALAGPAFLPMYESAAGPELLITAGGEMTNELLSTVVNTCKSTMGVHKKLLITTAAAQPYAWDCS